MPDAGVPAVFVPKIQHAMTVIPEIVLTMTGVKTENVHWKKALLIVTNVRKIVKRVY